MVKNQIPGAFGIVQVQAHAGIVTNITVFAYIIPNGPGGLFGKFAFHAAPKFGASGAIFVMRQSWPAANGTVSMDSRFRGNDRGNEPVPEDRLSLSYFCMFFSEVEQLKNIVPEFFYGKVRFHGIEQGGCDHYLSWIAGVPMIETAIPRAGVIVHHQQHSGVIAPIAVFAYIIPNGVDDLRWEFLICHAMAEMGTCAAILGLIGKGLLATDTAVLQRFSGCAKHWFIGSKIALLRLYGKVFNTDGVNLL